MRMLQGQRRPSAHAVMVLVSVVVAIVNFGVQFGAACRSYCGLEGGDSYRFDRNVLGIVAAIAAVWTIAVVVKSVGRRRLRMAALAAMVLSSVAVHWPAILSTMLPFDSIGYRRASNIAMSAKFADLVRLCPDGARRVRAVLDEEGKHLVLRRMSAVIGAGDEDVRELGGLRSNSIVPARADSIITESLGAEGGDNGSPDDLVSLLRIMRELRVARIWKEDGYCIVEWGHSICDRNLGIVIGHAESEAHASEAVSRIFYGAEIATCRRIFTNAHYYRRLAV